jgi:hypothetical protein
MNFSAIIHEQVMIQPGRFRGPHNTNYLSHFWYPADAEDNILQIQPQKGYEIEITEGKEVV